MKSLRICIIIVSLFAMNVAHAAETEDWSTFSRVLSLMQLFLSGGNDRQDDANRANKQLDSLLSGSNADANKLLNEALEGVPTEQRQQVLGIARQLALAGQRQAVQERQQLEEKQATHARAQLTAMGLSYFDQKQFLDAVKRNDLIAVRLYCAGRGVDLGGARELAKNAGLAEMEQVLAGATTQNR